VGVLFVGGGGGEGLGLVFLDEVVGILEGLLVTEETVFVLFYYLGGFGLEVVDFCMRMGVLLSYVVLRSVSYLSLMVILVMSY
jgi:hypothetical protein